MIRPHDRRIWRRQICALTALVAVALATGSLLSAARAATKLVPQDELQHVGLTREWFGQVRVNHARNQLERAVLRGDRLTTLTTAGVVQDFNALTGALYWTAPIGNGDYPSLGPACSDKYVALVNGSTLYILDRTDGRPVDIRKIGGAPGASPALSEKYVFVPTVSGRIEGYSLENFKIRTPWYYQCSGRTMIAPLVTPESVVWSSDNGDVYVGNSENPGMRFRLETGSEILATPAYKKPLVFVASLAGDVFAGLETTGKRQWKYSTGFPVSRSVAPVGDVVFATSDEPALHCIDAKTGSAIWVAPHVMQFAAASKTRVYGVDDLGGLVVLDAAKGSVVGRITTDHPIHSLVNDQTDRVYLVSRNGVIECLREIDSKEPLYHQPKEGAMKADATAAGQPAKAASAEKPAATKPEKSGTEKKDETPANTNKPEKPAGDFGVKDSENPFGN